ncbi:hypothetical protein KEM56_006479 [Ascosphaera pollenicola]|nr:hypothetical protein KEM56_006479 [Ascosphaera pollenicola]
MSSSISVSYNISQLQCLVNPDRKAKKGGMSAGRRGFPANRLRYPQVAVHENHTSSILAEYFYHKIYTAMARLSGIPSPVKQVRASEIGRRVDASHPKKLDFDVALLGSKGKEASPIDLEQETPLQRDAKAERRARLLALAAKAKSRHVDLYSDNSCSEDESRHSDNSTDESIAGFIVSDEEEITYSETSWLACLSSSEDEKPAKPRRRLLRGRRPSYTVKDSTTTNTQSSSSATEWERPVEPPISEQQSRKPSRHLQSTVQTADRKDRSTSRTEKDVRELLPPIILETSEPKNPGSIGKAHGSDSRISLTSSTSSTETSDHGLSTRDPSDRLSGQVYQLPTPESRLQSPSKRRTRTSGTSSQRFIRYTTRDTRPIDQLFDFGDFSDNSGSDLDDLIGFNERVTPRAEAKDKTTSKSIGKSKTAALADSRNAKKEKQAKKRAFDGSKDSMAKGLLQTLDELVTHGEIQSLAASEGGVHITWSKTLNKTAGRANWKRVVVRSSNRGLDDADSSPTAQESQTPLEKAGNRTIRHIASIELAEKIIDCEERLYNTLAHEFCHLANFMVSHVVDNPHGESFRCWAAKCMIALAKHPIYGPFDVKITTKHSYKIDYKYVWSCSGCALEYGRHSKSIDPNKVRCGRCKTGILTQIKPKPRSVSPKKKTPAKGSTNCTSAAGSAVEDLADKVKVISLD